MLKIVQYKNKTDVEKYFQQLDVVNDSWIIANLKTKQELQKRIIESKGYYLNTSVLRIRDFWLQIFNSQFPEYKIISKETYQIMVKNILEKYQDQIQIQVIDAEKKCQDLNYFSNLLLDPGFDLNSDRFNEWLNQFERRKFQLKSTLLVNKLIASLLLKQRTIPYEWVSCFLQAAGMDFSILKQTRFYFDLASEISMKEAEFIYELSKEKEIIVFQSEFVANQKYHFLLKPYDFFNSKITKTQLVKSEDPALQPMVTLRKFSNSLAECRDVVGQVQKWVAQGINPSQIQILAPQIELFWPLLEPLFKIQKIPVQKNKVFKIVTLPQVQLVLAKVKFYQRKAGSSDLEKILFLNQEKSYCSYNDFKEAFSSPFYNFDELVEKIKEKMPALFSKDLKVDLQSVDLKKELRRSDFFTQFSFLFEDHLVGEVFDHVISELFKGSHEEMTLQLGDWFEWMVLSLQKLEIKIETQVQGIRIDSLMSSQSFNCEYVYVLGADDTYFANTHDVDMDPDDILSLATELGYYLDHPDYNFRTYELESTPAKTEKELILSYTLKDLKGEISNPSAVWQKLAFEQKLTEKPLDLHLPTMWDSYQQSDPQQYYSQQNQKYDFDNYLKDQDLTLYKKITNDEAGNGAGKNYSLSPSSVKNFSECRFKFYMQKELQVEESDVEEIDISSKEKGLWYHRVYQLIIENWDSFIQEWKACHSTDEQIVFLQEKFQKEMPKTIAGTFWDKIKKRYFSNIISFIQHEINLRDTFPSIVNIGCEVKWQAYFDEEACRWSKEKPAKGFLFRGTIDRIVLNKTTGKIWVIDYKLGSSQVQSHGSWAKDNNWQLMYYTLAVENGWIDSVTPAPVELAQYWVVNKWEIKKGYLEGQQEAFVKKSKKDPITEENKKQLEIKFNEFIAAQLKLLREGYFPPQPKEEKICRKCQWSLTCRAPHLN